jgi:Transposase DDE domain group 1
MAECSRPALGRPSEKPIVWFKGFLYQVARWKTARRVVAKVEFHAEELFLRVGFIVTNVETPSRAVVRFYNTRETAEQWIKEGKQAVKMTRFFCHRFRPNQMRLALSLLAYNLENLSRRLALPKRIENCSLTESAATTGEDGRAAGEECPLPLASSGRRTSDSVQWQ